MFNANFKLGLLGTKLNKSFESLGPRDEHGNFTNFKKGRWYPYHGTRDAAGVWTIGFGHVCSLAERQHYDLLGATQTEIDTLFANDMVKYSDLVKKHCPVELKEQHRFDAIQSMVYNCGPSFLDPKHGMHDALVAGNWTAAAAHFLDYVITNGEVTQGLVRRRAVECLLFHTGELRIVQPGAELKDLLHDLVFRGVLSKTGRYMPPWKA